MGDEPWFVRPLPAPKGKDKKSKKTPETTVPPVPPTPEPVETPWVIASKERKAVEARPPTPAPPTQGRPRPPSSAPALPDEAREPVPRSGHVQIISGPYKGYLGTIADVEDGRWYLHGWQAETFGPDELKPVVIEPGMLLKVCAKPLFPDRPPGWVNVMDPFKGMVFPVTSVRYDDIVDLERPADDFYYSVRWLHFPEDPDPSDRSDPAPPEPETPDMPPPEPGAWDSRGPGWQPTLWNREKVDRDNDENWYDGGDDDLQIPGYYTSAIQGVPLTPIDASRLMGWFARMYETECDGCGTLAMRCWDAEANGPNRTRDGFVFRNVQIVLSGGSDNSDGPFIMVFDPDQTSTLMEGNRYEFKGPGFTISSVERLVQELRTRPESPTPTPTPTPAPTPPTPPGESRRERDDGVLRVMSSGAMEWRGNKATHGPYHAINAEGIEIIPPQRKRSRGGRSWDTKLQFHCIHTEGGSAYQFWVNVADAVVSWGGSNIIVEIVDRVWGKTKKYPCGRKCNRQEVQSKSKPDIFESDILRYSPPK